MVTTKEIQCKLRELRDDLNELLVIAWMHEKRENPQEIADAVGMMAEVLHALAGQIDLFIGNIEMSRDPLRNVSGMSARDQSESAELTDLPFDDDGKLLRQKDA